MLILSIKKKIILVIALIAILQAIEVSYVPSLPLRLSNLRGASSQTMQHKLLSGHVRKKKSIHVFARKPLKGLR